VEISEKYITRFMGRISFFDKDKCWEWTGLKNEHGYGLFYNNKKLMKAHRFSLIIAKGLKCEKDLGGYVLHKCDNPCCVNPDHLYVGTQKDNARDKVSRKRDHQTKKTHCPKGHEYSGENLRVYKNGRYCRACQRKRTLAHYYKKAEENKEKNRARSIAYYYKNLDECRRKSRERQQKKNGH
jgi:hypothetical protein